LRLRPRLAIIRRCRFRRQFRPARATLAEALRAGHAVLNTNGSSMDAVVAAIKILEDSPLFNAGKGAVLTALSAFWFRKTERSSNVTYASRTRAGNWSCLRIYPAHFRSAQFPYRFRWLRFTAA